MEGLEERQAEDDELFPAGIVFQGYPSSGRREPTESRDAATAFLTDKDLFIRALALSPPIFDDWVRDCGFLVTLTCAIINAVTSCQRLPTLKIGIGEMVLASCQRAAEMQRIANTIGNRLRLLFGGESGIAITHETIT